MQVYLQIAECSLSSAKIRHSEHSGPSKKTIIMFHFSPDEEKLSGSIGNADAPHFQ